MKRRPPKYGLSKFVLTSASIFSFGVIAALVSVKGPFGSSSAAQSQTQAVQQNVVRDDGATLDNNVRASDTGNTYSIPSQSVPVARSRGS